MKEFGKEAPWVVPEHDFHFNPEADTLNVIIHGSSKGKDSPLIQKIYARAQAEGHSVVALNLPYMTNHTYPSYDLSEEVTALGMILIHTAFDRYQKVRLIGKSLGGVVASDYSKRLMEEHKSKFDIVVLGYDTGSIDLKDFRGEITVIQGSKDGFGDVARVAKDLEGSTASKINLVSIEGADHSYRVPRTKNYKFEDQAVEAVFSPKAEVNF